MEIKGKNVLITGGTGSFGREVANFLSAHDPSRIIVYSRDEKKQYEMARHYPDYQYVIGDVRDKDRLKFAMKGVNLVFHAAALKQVPSCEISPFEAVKTNILGSQNLAEVAIDEGVESVVALSTDKAVKPVNAMGTSKAMMEKIICSQNQRNIDTKFCCVRYGNVMGSRGSVIPLFRELIDAGKPLTITDPKMTRFLLTLPQSVELVLYALKNAKGGELFVKKAPAVKIEDLAKSMIKKYAGNKEVDLNVVGVRPGEKIHEVLVSEYEILRAEENEDFFTIGPEYRKSESQLNYDTGYEYTSENTKQLIRYEDINNLFEKMGNNQDLT